MKAVDDSSPGKKLMSRKGKKRMGALIQNIDSPSPGTPPTSNLRDLTVLKTHLTAFFFTRTGTVPRKKWEADA